MWGSTNPLVMSIEIPVGNSGSRLFLGCTFLCGLEVIVVRSAIPRFEFDDTQNLAGSITISTQGQFLDLAFVASALEIAFNFGASLLDITALLHYLNKFHYSTFSKLIGYWT